MKCYIRNIITEKIIVIEIEVHYAASDLAICPNMKLTTLEKVFFALKELKYEVKVPEKHSHKKQRKQLTRF